MLLITFIINNKAKLSALFDCLCGQSSWLQIRRSRVRFPALQKKLVNLERGPLSLVSATEELLGSNSNLVILKVVIFNFLPLKLFASLKRPYFGVKSCFGQSAAIVYFRK
jgi:hypothetical protein